MGPLPNMLVRVTVGDGVVPNPSVCDTGTFTLDSSFLCNGNCGDCDQAGLPAPNIVDALIAAQIAAAVVLPTPQQIGCCDVNDTRTVDVIDALLIAQVAAQLPITLNCP